MVRPVSTPQPAASGQADSKASRVRHRMPDSGWVAVQPVAASMPERASRTTNPCPPPGPCGGSRAIVMSASPATTGATSGAVAAALPPRSASTNSSAYPPSSLSATAAAPVVIAAPLPRLRGWRTTWAPACMACREVWSLEPSSTTTTSVTPGIERAAVTVAAIRSASSLAGITTATPVMSSTR